MQTPPNELLFYSLLSAALILGRIPVIGKFFRVANTMVHESGHALMALLTSGSVVSVDLFHDTSGNAVTKSKYWAGKFVVALAGYCCSSFAALGLFLLLKNGQYTTILYILGITAVVNLILWVRNTYGVIWLILFLGLCVGDLYLQKPQLTYGMAVFFSGVIFWDALASAAVIFYLGFAAPAKAGDAKNLKDFTYIPAFFWGTLFLAQAVFAAYLTVKLFFHLPF